MPSLLTSLQPLIFGLGCVAAVALLGVLLVTILSPELRLWPTPGPGTWQSFVFWPLFRGLNALCLAAAIAGWPGGALKLPVSLRFVAFVLLIGSVVVFVTAFRLLGRDNSYGAQDGLVTGGIYQWSRNPQNAMLVLVYACLAVSADSTPAYVLCAAMMAAYTLMILAEEPWLAGIYGDAYRRYCREVPRFFNWRRALSVGWKGS